MRRNWFVALIAAILTSALLDGGCSREDMVTKEAALEIARKSFADSHGDEIREFKISDSALDSDDGYWRFFAQGTGEYARPGYHATIEVDRNTGQATVIMGE